MESLTLRTAFLVALLSGAGLSVGAADDQQRELDQALMSHVRRGATKEVGELLEKGADPNAANPGRGGKTALHYAAKTGNLQIMRMLIKRGANLNAVSGDGRTPVFEAAGNHSGDALALLLKAGAKATPGALGSACWLNRKESITLLLAAGVTPDAGMVWAARAGRVKLLRRLLDEGANVNAKSPDGNSPLHAAPSQGGIEAVTLLLKAGADPNATNDRGETPLHMAISGEGLLGNIRLLLKANANPNQRDKQLIAPIRLAAIRGHREAYELLLKANRGIEPRGVMPRDADAYHSDKTTNQLIRDLSSKDHATRKTAELALVTRGARIVPDALKAIESGTAVERFHDVLTKLGPEARIALPKLTSLLGDKRHVVSARLTMEQMKPGYFEQLPAKTRDKADAALYEAATDPRLFVTTTFFLRWLSTPSLLKLLRSDQSKHRSAAMSSITRSHLKSPEVEGELIKILLKDESHSARVYAATILGRWQTLSKQAKAALLKVVKMAPPHASNIRDDNQRQQRMRQLALSKTAARSLAIAGPEIIDELLPLVTPMNNPARTAAMEALKGLGAAGVPRLIELLSHEDDAIATSAGGALGRIGKPAVPALSQAVISENQQVRSHALSALWWIGGIAKEAVPTLLKIVNSKDFPDGTRIAAARTALKIDPEGARDTRAIAEIVPMLIRVFEEEEFQHQRWAAEALRDMGPAGQEALPTLRKFVEAKPASEDPQYFYARRQAKRAISKIEAGLSKQE